MALQGLLKSSARSPRNLRKTEQRQLALLLLLAVGVGSLLLRKVVFPSWTLKTSPTTSCQEGKSPVHLPAEGGGELGGDMRGPASVLCPCLGEYLWQRAQHQGFCSYPGEPREDCILGLGLAVSPMGVSTVTSQGAGREPYNKRGGTRIY